MVQKNNDATSKNQTPKFELEFFRKYKAQQSLQSKSLWPEEQQDFIKGPPPSEIIFMM